jgi:hypothetical protein
MLAATMAVLLLQLSRQPTSRAQAVSDRLAVAAAVTFLLGFVAVRTQLGVGDRQLLQSMIPHESATILMCERASLSHPEVVALCRRLIASRRVDIEQMQILLTQHPGLAGAAMAPAAQRGQQHAGRGGVGR